MGNLRIIEVLVVLICVLPLVMPILETPLVSTQNSPEVVRLIGFFRDVLLIDTSHCSVSGGSHAGPGYDNSPELGTRGVSQGKVTLTFDSGGSIDSLFEFRGKYLTWCLIYYDTGNTNPIPYIKSPSGTPLDMAKDFLDRYKIFTNDSRIDEMKQLLSTVSTVEQISQTDGDLKITITVREGKPDFDWSYTFEGEDYRLLSISFFSPPHIFTFSDHSYKYNTNNSVIPKYEPINTASDFETVLASFSTEYSSADENILSFSVSKADLNSYYFTAFWLATLASSIVTIFIIQNFNKKKNCNKYFTSQLFNNNLSLRLKEKLPKKVLAIGFMFLLLFSIEAGLESISVAQANFMYPPLEKIYIQNNGSISPQTGLISRAGNVYTLIGNIVNNPIEVQCDNIVINGGEFSLLKNTPAYGLQDALSLKGRNNVTIRDLNVSGYDYGIFVSNSRNCQITKNTFSGNKYGIVLADRSSGNNITCNRWFSGGGISVYTSINNVLRNNSINGSGPNFWVDCENVTSTSDYINDIDESNTINGKPIYYWVNQRDRAIPSNGGYVALINCSSIIVENLNLSNNGEGLLLISTKNTQVINNIFTKNNKGIAIYHSQNNSFTSNNLTNNTYAIICRSRPNTFKNNQLANNTYDANFEDRFFDEFDRSNIVDGKPICYWLWQHDKIVPPDSGYVVLLSCQNITVQNLNITNRRQAMLLMELTNSIITRNIITNNQASILLKGSSNNKIAQNLIANNTDGIYVQGAHSNEISLNKIAFNVNFGIHLDDDNDNDITYNYISHSKIGYTMNRGSGNNFSGNTILYTTQKGMHIGESLNNNIIGNNFAWSKGYALTISGDIGNNNIHHNNFINNAGSDAHQGYPGANTPNQWDDGYEGNFWGDYQNKYPTGKQIPELGIWDTAVTLNANNIDRFPLTTPVTMKYHVIILHPSSTSYNVTEVPLSFFNTGIVPWMGYSLDDNANVTFIGDILLTNLEDGIHILTVFAGSEGGDCAVETIYFALGQNITMPPAATPTPKTSPTPQSSISLSPSPTPADKISSPTPTNYTENNLQTSDISWITIGSIIVASVSIITLFVIKQRKNSLKT